MTDSTQDAGNAGTEGPSGGFGDAFDANGGSYTSDAAGNSATIDAMAGGGPSVSGITTATGGLIGMATAPGLAGVAIGALAVTGGMGANVNTLADIAALGNQNAYNSGGIAATVQAYATQSVALGTDLSGGITAAGDAGSGGAVYDPYWWNSPTSGGGSEGGGNG